jgi:hypothetical protein
MSIFFDIHWLAVIAAVIASMAVGFVWYGPLFGKRWAAAIGNGKAAGAPVPPEAGEAAIAQEAPTAKPKAGSPQTARISMLVITLVQCFLISSLIDYYKGAIGSVILWAVVIWLAIVIPLLATELFFDKRKIEILLISAGHQLVSLVVVAFILGIWY